MKPALCADLGGTNWKLAVMQNGQPLALMHVPNTNDIGDLVALPEHFSSLLKQTPFTLNDCVGLGISLAEIVDSVLKTCPSPSYKHPYFEGQNIESVVRQFVDVPVAVDNDARAALFGEEQYGVLAGAELETANHLIITLGTGIGVGARVNGTILRGANGAGSTLGGHITIDSNGPECMCGNVGCAEAVASGWVLEQRMPQQNWFRKSSLSQLPQVGFLELTEAVRAGDQYAMEGLQLFINTWESLLVSLLHVLNPSKVVIAGAFSLSGDLFIDALKQGVKSRLWDPNHCPEFLLSNAPDIAGVRGAEALIRDLTHA